MNQDQLDRAVARITGESMATIRRRGFSLAPLRVVKVRQRRCSANKSVKLRAA